MSEIKLPASIVVQRVFTSRYPNLEKNFYNCLKRPLSWDERVSGTEEIMTECKQRILLNSTGQQPTPEPGWKLVLTGGNSTEGYEWTLYGLAVAAA